MPLIAAEPPSLPPLPEKTAGERRRAKKGGFPSICRAQRSHMCGALERGNYPVMGPKIGPGLLLSNAHMGPVFGPGGGSSPFSAYPPLPLCFPIRRFSSSFFSHGSPPPPPPTVFINCLTAPLLRSGDEGEEILLRRNEGFWLWKTLQGGGIAHLGLEKKSGPHKKGSRLTSLEKESLCTFPPHSGSVKTGMTARVCKC